jgi:hypothetical protein
VGPWHPVDEARARTVLPNYVHLASPQHHYCEQPVVIAPLIGPKFALASQNGLINID